MKRYGKRFWKVGDFLTVLILIVGMFVIDVHVLFSGKHFEISLLLIILAFNFLPFGFWKAFNYIELTDDSLTVRNDIYTFREKEYDLKEIKGVIAKYDQRGYFRIWIEDDEKKRHSFYTQALTDAMMHELANELRAKGIAVDIPDGVERA